MRLTGAAHSNLQPLMRLLQNSAGLGLLAFVGTIGSAAPVTAQDVPERLSLEQAIEIAQTTNPGFLQTRNDEALADWNVREAWGQLMPSANASGGLNWQGSGDSQLGGSLTLAELGFGDRPSYVGSRYFLGVGYSVDWATILGPRRAETDRRGTRAQISAATSALTSQVTAAYIQVQRQQDALRIAEQQLENSRLNLRLAQGRLEVGQATPIDVGQAEVQVGRGEVAVLQTSNGVATSRMRLLQLLGLSVDQPFELTTRFALSAPTWTIEELTRLATEKNPDLVVRRSSVDAADIGVKSAWSSYFPSLSISTGWSGFAQEATSVDFLLAQAQAGVASTIQQCVRTNDLYSRLASPLPPIDCGQYAFTDAQRQEIISNNDRFPFGFTRSPPSVSLSLNVPLFSGFSRQRNLQAARLQRDDARHQLREQELAVQAELAIGLADVRTAYESALLEDRNRLLAERQLTLARERYQLGAITFVELIEAQTLFAQADVDRTAAVFAYHDAVTNLEGLVGSPLRF